MAVPECSKLMTSTKCVRSLAFSYCQKKKGGKNVRKLYLCRNWRNGRSSHFSRKLDTLKQETK